MLKNNANFKRFNNKKKDELETKLTQWVHSKNQMGLVPGGEDIKHKAKSLSDKMGCAKKIDFTNGWLDRYKKRHDLRCKQSKGEKQNADFQSAENSDIFKQLNEILETCFQL